MSKKNAELVFVIDRSGSMGGLESDTIGGVNAVLAENRKLKGEAHVTTVLFDHEIKYLHDHANLRDVADLTSRDYQVRGCTALLDAVGDAITHTTRVQGYIPKAFRADKVIVTIVTDGFENASKRYTYAQIRKLIDEKTGEGWEFLFLGANIDVAAEAGKLGIRQEYATPYVSDGMGTRLAYEAVACAQVSARTVGHVDSAWANPTRADAANRG